MRILWLLILIPVCMLSACRSLEPSTNETVERDQNRMQGLAHEAMSRGDVDRATSLYLRQLDEARRTDNPESLIDAAAWATRALIASGRFREIDPILSEAELAAERVGRPDAALTLLRSAVQRRDGQVEQAILNAQRILLGEIPSTRDQQLEALLLAGHAELDRGQLDNALLALTDARHLARELNTPSARARAVRLEARLAEERQAWAEAARLGDLEAGYWRLSHRYRAMAYALHRSARAHARAGDGALAADRALRAGLSLRAQGQDDDAREALHLAIAAASEAQDTTRLRLAEKTLDELKAQEPDASTSAE